MTASNPIGPGLVINQPTTSGPPGPAGPMGPTGPAGAPGPVAGWVDGLAMDYSGPTTGNVAAGSCMDSTNTRILSLATYTGFDIAIVGAGGRDQAGAFAADTWIAQHLIENPSGADVLLASASFTAPTIPVGYGPRFRWIGTLYNANVGQLASFRQYGRNQDRTYFWNDPLGSFADGAAGPQVRVFPITVPVYPLGPGAAFSDFVGLWNVRVQTSALVGVSARVDFGVPPAPNACSVLAPLAVSDSETSTEELPLRAFAGGASLIATIPDGVLLFSQLRGWRESLFSGPPASPTPAAVSFNTDTLPVAAPGQTAFTLSQVPLPAEAANLLLFVNGASYVQGVSFTLAGAALTWLDVPFTLQTTDAIIAYYQA